LVHNVILLYIHIQVSTGFKDISVSLSS